MGLDMYLMARLFLSKYGHPDEMEKRDAIKKACNFTYEQSNIEGLEVSFEIMYWRKANQIHAWFVKNVQGGEDNCATYSVGRDQLQELLELCKKSLKAKNPDEVLPTQGGFFFGSTEYDDDYKQDLKDTIKGLERILKDKSLEDYSFYYHSSW